MEEYEETKNQSKINRKINFNEENKEEVWRRLLKNKLEDFRKREEIKMEAEKKDISQNCTFHPDINSNFQLINEETNVYFPSFLIKMIYIK